MGCLGAWPGAGRATRHWSDPSGGFYPSPWRDGDREERAPPSRSGTGDGTSLCRSPVADPACSSPGRVIAAPTLGVLALPPPRLPQDLSGHSDAASQRGYFWPRSLILASSPLSCVLLCELPAAGSWEGAARLQAARPEPAEYRLGVVAWGPRQLGDHGFSLPVGSFPPLSPCFG